MEIKYTIQGLLIYISIAAYLLALLVSLLRRPRAAHTLYVLGFVVALVSFGYRWHHVRHVPMQNLFEVFLCLGMIYPVSVFCRRVLHIGGRSADMLIGAVVLVPAGFFFNADPQMLPPALQSWLFAPHVAVYMISYVFMTKAASHALWQLVGMDPKSDQNLLPPEEATYRLICIGFPLLTLGLVLGSVWGKLAWGDYWGWDPKELWSLASWTGQQFKAYLTLERVRQIEKKPYLIISLWAIAGVVVIVVTLLWVNLSRLFAGLHTYAAG